MPRLYHEATARKVHELVTIAGDDHLQSEHLLLASTNEQPPEQTWRRVVQDQNALVQDLQNRNDRLQAEVMRLVQCMNEHQDKLESARQVAVMLDHQREVNNKQMIISTHLFVENNRLSEELKALKQSKIEMQDKVNGLQIMLNSQNALIALVVAENERLSCSGNKAVKNENMALTVMLNARVGGEQGDNEKLRLTKLQEQQRRIFAALMQGRDDARLSHMPDNETSGCEHYAKRPKPNGTPDEPIH